MSVCFLSFYLGAPSFFQYGGVVVVGGYVLAPSQHKIGGVDFTSGNSSFVLAPAAKVHCSSWAERLFTARLMTVKAKDWSLFVGESASWAVVTVHFCSDGPGFHRNIGRCGIG